MVCIPIFLQLILTVYSSLLTFFYLLFFYSYYGYTERFYGRNIAAAYYILNSRGGFR